MKHHHLEHRGQANPRKNILRPAKAAGDVPDWLQDLFVWGTRSVDFSGRCDSTPGGGLVVLEETFPD